MSENGDSSNTIASLAAIRTGMDHLVAQFKDLGEKIEPVLLARSGDMVRMETLNKEVAQLRADLLESHNKHRAHYKDHADIERRLSKAESSISSLLEVARVVLKLEKQFERGRWVFIGAFAVVQVLLQYGPEWMEKLSK